MKNYEYTIGRDDINLKAEQKKILNGKGLHSNLILPYMYWWMDFLYGKEGSFLKFKVLEILARCPYISWELNSYKQITKHYSSKSFSNSSDSERSMQYIELGRKSQDNEQLHLMLIEDIMRQKNIKQPWLKSVFFPKIMAWKYFIFSNILFFLKPEWSFAMNAKFESHATREYMKMVEQHPEWETETIDSYYFKYYPKQNNLADLFRRIALDERDHMYESMVEYERITGTSLD